ncbi:MAG: GGDEF domain-containing protein [Planctomycetes bacterium]|nr:GGDEF domain-containing protein [Planctomycetota bacterium]
MPRLWTQFDVEETARWLERRSKLDVFSMALLALTPIVAVDIKLGPHISLSGLTLAPVFLVGCFGGRIVSYAYAVVAAFCEFAESYRTLPVDASTGLFIWAFVSRVITYIFMAEISSQFRDLIQQYARHARTDGLTGLSNHRDLCLQTERVIGAAKRDGRPVSAAFIDCDNFKQVNDRFGHAEGDAVLRAVAGVLKRCTRPADVVARVGGDEFALIMPATDREGGRQAIARIQAELARAMGELERDVTFSIGAATFDTPPASGESLLASIDECQYLAKKGGKDRFVYLGPPAGLEKKVA